MGVALGGVAAISATIFYMLHHIPVKTSLFLVEGIVERETGSSTLGRVSGLARRSGPLAALFLIPAFSLAGLPPFSGFLGKTAVVTEGLDQRSWWIVGAALAVSLMTLVSMLKIWGGAFWGAPDPMPSNGEHAGILRKHPLMSGVTTAVVTLTLLIAVFAGPLYRFCERAAIDVTDSLAYPTAVLP